MNYKKLAQIMKAAESMAELSPDSQTKVGSCLVSEDGYTYATAYNGFVKGAPDNILPNTRPDKYKYIVHSEINLIAVCAKEGISTKGKSVVVTMSPCINCMRAMYQAGISTIYFKEEYKDFQSQLNQKDLRINLSKVKEFSRIDLEPNIQP